MVGIWVLEQYILVEKRILVQEQRSLGLVWSSWVESILVRMAKRSLVLVRRS